MLPSQLPALLERSLNSSVEISKSYHQVLAVVLELDDLFLLQLVRLSLSLRNLSLLDLVVVVVAEVVLLVLVVVVL